MQSLEMSLLALSLEWEPHGAGIVSGFFPDVSPVSSQCLVILADEHMFPVVRLLLLLLL